MPRWLGNGKQNTLDVNNEDLTIEVGARSQVGGWAKTTASSTLGYVMEASWDGGTTFYAVPWLKWTAGSTAPRPQSTVSGVSLVGSTDDFQFAIPIYGGMTHVRVRLTSYSGGGLAVEMHASDSPPGVVVAVPVDAQGNMGSINITSTGTASDIGKQEDVPHTSGDTGIMALAVRNDGSAGVPAAMAGSNGDYIPITTDSLGRLWTAPSGNVAHDGVDAGNPIKIGGRARSSEIAAVSSDDRADFITDLVGKQIVLPYSNPENFVSGAITSAMTGTTSTSLLAAPGAGLRNYVTQITVSNSHATVGTDIIIQDGSGGTTLYVIPAAAVYGGAVITFPTPLRQPTLNTALFCANVTTGSNTKVSASGYKGA